MVAQSLSRRWQRSRANWRAARPRGIRRENVTGPQVLAQACNRHGVRLMSLSSDLVFDGGKDQPYVERDRTQPLNAYGRAKREAERRMLSFCRGALAIRTAAFFGP